MIYMYIAIVKKKNDYHKSVVNVASYKTFILKDV